MKYRCDKKHTFDHTPKKGALMPRCPECGGFTKRVMGGYFSMKPDPYERDFREMEANGEFDLS